MRADAARNKERILEAARRLVAAQGPDVSMEAIAGLAGVAVGTLYRHHPTKAALLRAVVADSAEQLAAASSASLDRARAGGHSGVEFDALMRLLADRLAVDQSVKAAATALGEQVPHDDPGAYPATSAVGRATSAMAELLQRAQREGAVRPDVTFGDLVLLVSALPDAGVPAPQRDRVVDVVLSGLRAPPGPATAG